MQIAVLGAGHIGGTLADKWAQAGHSIHFGLRDPQKAELQALVKSLGGKASAASIAGAISAAEVVLFAIPGGAMEETVRAHAQALQTKIIVDAANNMRGASLNSMAVFAEQTPRASVYRAFNIYGWENFRDAEYGGERADLFYCGTDGAARPQVEQLIAEVGMNPVYVGGVDQAGAVDGLLKLWIALVQSQQMGRHFAFKIVKG